MPAKKTVKKAAKKVVKKATKTGVQPELNIGLVGHVDHGKTTLTQKLSGKWTDTHSEELKRGITIRLGYANFSIYDKGGKLFAHKEPGSTFVRKLSLVDAPGHESLMATMLAGSMIMDGGLLLVSANEEFPQAQTKEHLSALEIVGIDKIIVVQNKIDLVEPEVAVKQYEKIKKYLADTRFKDAPIIPISAFYGINLDVLLATIQEEFPTPKRDGKKDPRMIIARSFDINKPGSKIAGLSGGVLGGAVMQGKFKIGDEIELGPEKMIGGKPVRLKTKIVGLMTGSDAVEQVTPGGSVALLTTLDPAVVKGDTLSGCIVAAPGKLPPTWHELKIEVQLLERIVGTKDEEAVKPIADKEMLMLNVNSAATVGIVRTLRKGIATCELKIPVCADIGDRVTISRRVGNRFRLVGFGIIQK